MVEADVRCDEGLMTCRLHQTILPSVGQSPDAKDPSLIRERLPISKSEKLVVWS